MGYKNFKNDAVCIAANVLEFYTMDLEKHFQNGAAWVREQSQ